MEIEEEIKAILNFITYSKHTKLSMIDKLLIFSDEFFQNIKFVRRQSIYRIIMMDIFIENVFINDTCDRHAHELVASV